MRVLSLAVLLCMSAVPAWADGALAVGCRPDGTVVWGYQIGEDSVDAAKPKALQQCQLQGSDCTLLRLALNGNGAWFALAVEPRVPGRCSPVGEYYSASKDTAAQMAIADCQKHGGQQCVIELLKQNKPTVTYHTVPGGPDSDISTSITNGVRQRVQQEQQNRSNCGNPRGCGQ